MSIEERLKMYREKRQFLYDVSMAFIKNPKGHTVDGIVYEVFFSEEAYPYRVSFSEWLTVQYRGGAEARCCVSGNSNSANFEVVARMINGGNYAENAYYQDLLYRGWRELDLNKMVGLHEVK
jgi:hypothetical protein